MSRSPIIYSITSSGFLIFINISPIMHFSFIILSMAFVYISVIFLFVYVFKKISSSSCLFKLRYYR